ncbi:MAG: tetratricopeptide repeat protein [Verrucomicrobia bacterium]|nr:tetratricopeptide repeat protein [Verrucomicrobiota bacterium]
MDRSAASQANDVTEQTRSDTDKSTASQYDWVFGLLLAIVILITYLPAWNGAPIWDDNAHITSPELRSLEGLSRIWAHPGATQQYYPLAHTIFWIEHRLWGDSPLGYHLINLLLLWISTLLLLQILRRLQIPGAWLAAAIFALHPMQVESVAWISELKNTLSGVFYFGSVFVYLRFDRERKPQLYIAALLLFVCGLLSKTVIATLPGALLVVLWWKRGRLLLKPDILPVVPFFIIGAAASLFTAWIERNLVGANGADYSFSFIERLLIAGRVIWFYLGKLIWPLDLLFIYPRWQISQSIWWQYLFPVSLLLFLGVLCWLSRRWRAPLAGFLFFVGTLFPVLGFLNVYPFRYSLVADHFQYLACLGIIVPASAGIAQIVQNLHRRHRLFGYAFCAVLIFSFSVLSAAQSRMYTDAETVWNTTISRNPTAWMAHNNLGALLLQQGQLDQAINHFRSAIDIKPDEASAYMNLGDALLLKREWNEAIEEYQKALELKPELSGAHYNLANALLGLGQIDDAIAQYQEALRINPNNADAHNNLGAVLFQKGQFDEAIAHYQKALEINPQDVRARGNIAWAFATSPQPPVRKAIAVKLAEQANQLSGGANPGVLRVLAAAYAQNGQFPDAAETAGRALQLAMARDNSVLADSLRSEIELYQTGLPYRLTR